MSLKNLGVTGLLFLLGGCTSFQSQVKNYTKFTQPTGPNVYVEVLDAENAPLHSLAAGDMRDEANQWLKQKGYTVTNEPKQANASLKIVADRSISGSVYSYHRGMTPVLVSQGGIYPSYYDDKSYEGDTQLRKAVGDFLDKSALAKVKRIPASNNGEGDAACWYRVGIIYEPASSSDGLRIKGFIARSQAQAKGLKVGDVVLQVNDKPPTLVSSFTEGQRVLVHYARNGEEREANVPVALICLGEH